MATASVPPRAMGVVKISVNLPEDAVAAVNDIAARRHITKTEVLRRGISLEKFLEDERDKGAFTLLVDRGGKTQQIVFPWLA